VSVQPTLFDEEVTPGRIDDYLGIPGLVLYRGLLDKTEQLAALAAIDKQSWRDDLKRRVQHYGYRYDYRARSVDQSMRLGELPLFAVPVAQRLFDLGLVPELPDQLIVNEYVPGQGITAHIDCVPCFKDGIVTVSLGSVYEMEFIHAQTDETRSTPLELGAALIMTGSARYEWMHQIKARKSDGGTPRGRRVSLTFRKVILTTDVRSNTTNGS
jgi:alkylated DNA repair dioxygenase AlkB